MKDEPIRVSIGEFKITSEDTLSITGLGSCIGLFLYEPEVSVGALAHILLGDSTNEKKVEDNPGRYASSAIKLIVEEITERGGSPDQIIAKIAGGAHMFNFSSPEEKITVGKRNIEAVEKKLKELDIEIVAQDTGGDYGRSIKADPSDGSVIINTIKYGEKTL